MAKDTSIINKEPKYSTPQDRESHTFCIVKSKKGETIKHGGKSPTEFLKYLIRLKALLIGK